MRDDEVPNKTDAGRDEIQQRTRKLPNVLRSILLLVDGQRSAGQLRDVIAGLRGPPDALEQLRSLGLVDVPQTMAAAAAASIPGREFSGRVTGQVSTAAVAAGVGAAPVTGGYAPLYTLMSDTVREHLGLRGYFLQLKIERCTDVGELLALLPDLSTALAKAHNVGFAGEMERRMRSLVTA
ncbi:hypothetical protein MNR01_15945 [Lysobacter sp. S4-A87]|uniref:hypothetical protein n=1 Tax=Lysobacter sp. S4-A87 TaxID=2925843 RepID=UPI001F538B8E|nr:hypothetical protein [Lysobacter sp. S4-A87]UNK49196.1 hypothetical protein MNR01_15945 [Lysobacter sp. S4-A87]